jgi:acyl-CoA synthetase (NDP forming)
VTAPDIDLLADPGIDAVIVLFVPPVVAGAEEVAEAVVRGVEAGGQSDKPVLAAFISDEGIPASLLRRGSGVAGFEYPESAARALAHAVDRAEWLRRPVGEPPVLDGIDRPAAEELIASALASGDDAWLRRSRCAGCSVRMGSRWSPSGRWRRRTRLSRRRWTWGCRWW